MLLPIHVYRLFNILYLECLLKRVNVLLEHGAPAQVPPYKASRKGRQ